MRTIFFRNQKPNVIGPYTMKTGDIIYLWNGKVGVNAQTLPFPFVLKFLNNSKVCTQTNRPPAPQEAKTALLLCIPYLGRYSLQIKTRLCRIIKQCYPGIKLQVIFRSPKRIQSFFPFKDHFPTLIRSSVVYKFQCPGCNALF